MADDFHKTPTEARTQEQIVSALRSEGIRFHFFDCVTEGNYKPEDAAWNYMDIPHLTYVHKQVDGVPTLTTDTVSAGVVFQKIPFLRIPMTVMLYPTSRSSVTYYMSFLFYLLVIETRWESLADIRTRVTTRYAIGHAFWLFGLGVPLIRWLLTRNYNILMSEDLPMREQRGRLRKLGYGFRTKGEIPSFLESRKITDHNVVSPEQNVIAPSSPPLWPSVTLALDSLRPNAVMHIGTPDHLGLNVIRFSDRVCVFPRLCPHEGACLDDSHAICPNDSRAKPTSLPTIQCPWHGRKFKPILEFLLPAVDGEFQTAWHHFKLSSESLLISCKQATETSSQMRDADWSMAAETCHN